MDRPALFDHATRVAVISVRGGLLALESSAQTLQLLLRMAWLYVVPGARG